MATFELYRRSTIGMCLTETLDEMVSNGVLSPELAIQVLVQFDKSMTEALDSQVKSKVTIKGHLHTYRFCDNVWTFIVQDAMFKYDDIQENVGQVKIVACDSKLLTHFIILVQVLSLFIALPKPTMASLKSDEGSQMKTYKFQDGMILQCDVYMFSNGHKAKVKFQLQNCSETWILHWGCISNGNKKWFVPSCYPSRTTVYMKTALCTPFIKYGDKYVVDIELQDPKIHAIEFVLKDTRHDKWLKKKNGASFCIKLHKENDVKIDGAGIAKDLVTETSRKNNTLRNMYVMSLEETCDEMVGEKSRNIRFLNKKIPTWIKFPASIVLPFGVFEKALSEDLNKEVAKKIAWLGEHVDGGDISKLKMVQETVMQMKAPHRMRMEVRKKMKSSRIPWPSGPPEDTWNRIWQAIKMVWASKWNEEAYRKTNITYDKSNKLKIGILVQEYIRADYAFVTYTYHPVSQDSSYIYTEIVKGSIETLVGVSLGRPMTCITKKSDLKSPIVTCYPSKSTGLYTRNKRSMIFRADFISDNTNNIYTSNGIYDSISMEKNEEVVLDYSRDRLVTDLRFQGLILSKIAEVAKNIEDMYGCAHNIEGVVQDEQVYILQCKPLL